MERNEFEKPNTEQLAEAKPSEAQTPWERLGITKEEYDELYKDDPEDKNVELYKQH